MRRHLIVITVAALSLSGCARLHRPGFPRPVRAAVLVLTDFDVTMAAISGMLETRGIPILLTDAQFGTIQSDWVYWEPGEVDLSYVTDCGDAADAPPDRMRARFRFDVRRRAKGSTVQIATQWQADKHPGFERGTTGFVDCRSTGEWERAVEEALTQRQTIR
jgi:hypothetical protein